MFAVKSINLDFTGIEGLHLSCLLNLKCQNAFEQTYRGIEKGTKNEVELSGQE